MRPSFRTALLPLAAFAITACEAREDETVRTDSAVAASPDVGAAREEAQIRVVHAVPGGPAVDVYAGDQSAFSNVEFKSVTEYRPLEIYTFLIVEYLALILIVSWAVRRLERRMAAADYRPA